MHRQPSLFGVDATDPSPADLAGLLAGPGELSRMGGTARVGVRVDAAWRVHVLIAECRLRNLPAGWEPDPDHPGSYLVRTAYTVRMLALARAWAAGPPARLHLAGPALRLWVAAAGAPAEGRVGFRLGLGAAGDRPPVAAALAGLGLPVTAAKGGYEITGRRPAARLAELVGDPPLAAPPGAWPENPPVRGTGEIPLSGDTSTMLPSHRPVAEPDTGGKGGMLPSSPP